MHKVDFYSAASQVTISSPGVFMDYSSCALLTAAQ